jgi:hypothetical protein
MWFGGNYSRQFWLRRVVRWGFLNCGSGELRDGKEIDKTIENYEEKSSSKTR